MRKEDLLNAIRANVRQKYDMPRLDDIEAITYPDTVSQFISMTKSVGGEVVEVGQGEDVNEIIRRLFPDAKEIASSLPEITIATRNPDTAESAEALNGTDVGVVRGLFGVAENACIYVPQTMKEKAVLFISENLVILLKKTEIVDNMHQAYSRLRQMHRQGTLEGLGDYGYGSFISGPSKTADIAQVLVMGAQAARSVHVLLV